MRRVAALDCGTNTLRLLVADLDVEAGEARIVERRSTIVRLGEGVDRTGRFAPAALARTFATLDEYVAVIDGYDVAARRFVATSAARDVRNRDEFRTGVRERIGVEPEVISGDEEARLTFDGATRGLRDEALPGPYLVLDIGGGSTELVVGERVGAPVEGVSLDVGSVRLLERHLHSDPPTPAEVAAVVADVQDALASAAISLAKARTVIGVAGSVVTIGALVLGLTSYDRERVHLARLPDARVRATIEGLVAMSVEQRRALPVMHPDRADVIGAGALILRTILDRLAALDRAGGTDRASGGAAPRDLVVSARDILDGVAWSLA